MTLLITDYSGYSDTLTLIKEINHSSKVNGEKLLAFSVSPEDPSFGLVVTESIVHYKNAEYIIRQVNERDYGNKTYKRVEAVHRFFIDMIDCFNYELFTGSQTFNAALNRVFGPTPYSFNIVDPFTAESFENFGRDNCLALFNQVLERYGAEFEVNSKTVTLRRSIGTQTDFQFRWGVNLKAIDKQEDTNNFATYIEGFGGEEREDGTFPVHETYTSPNAGAFDMLRHAEPVYDERRTTASNMQQHLRRIIIDEPQLSVTLTLADLRKAGYTANYPNAGDWGIIVYEPMNNFIVDARIVEVNETLNALLEPIDIQVTLSNIRRRLTDTVTRFANTSKAVDRLQNGQGKLPYNVLDDAVKIATQALQSAQTELKFENGIIAVEKTNENNLVLFNSAGIGISDDGGRTFKTAMTGHGIVADVITAGQLNANNVTVYGGSRDNYTNISGNTIESFGIHNRTWFGETTREQVRLRLQWGYFIAESMDEDQRLYYSNKGISTYLGGSDAEEEGGSEAAFAGSGVLEFFSHRYDPEVRGVTMSSNRGILALKTYTRDIILEGDRSLKFWSNRGDITFRPNMDNRPGNNEFQMYVKNNDNGSETDGILVYGSWATDQPYASGLRFQKTQAGDAIVHATNGNGDFNSGKFRAISFIGALEASQTGSNAYALVDDRLRVTNRRGYNDGNTSYRDLQCRDVMSNNVNASTVNADSSVLKKQNIEPFVDKVEPLLRKLEVMTYHLNEDIDQGNYYNQQVGLISELSPQVSDQKQESINLYKLASYLLKGVQELWEEIDKLKGDESL